MCDDDRRNTHLNPAAPSLGGQLSSGVVYSTESTRLDHDTEGKNTRLALDAVSHTLVGERSYDLVGFVSSRG